MFTFTQQICKTEGYYWNCKTG